jgi:hypothetical protein
MLEGAEGEFLAILSAQAKAGGHSGLKGREDSSGIGGHQRHSQGNLGRRTDVYHAGIQPVENERVRPVLETCKIEHQALIYWTMTAVYLKALGVCLSCGPTIASVFRVGRRTFMEATAANRTGARKQIVVLSRSCDRLHTSERPATGAWCVI